MLSRLLGRLSLRRHRDDPGHAWTTWRVFLAVVDTLIDHIWPIAALFGVVWIIGYVFVLWGGWIELVFNAACGLWVVAVLTAGCIELYMKLFRPRLSWWEEVRRDSPEIFARNVTPKGDDPQSAPMLDKETTT